MFRFSLRKILWTILMLGGLLVVVHLRKKSFHQTLSKEHVRTDSNKDSQLHQKTSYEFSWQTCIKKLSAKHTTNFSSLPARFQDFMYYQHCRHFPMLLDLPDKCGGVDQSSEVFLLLVIKSPPHHHDRREILRKTWATERLQYGVRIRRVFIAGTGGSGFEKERLNKVLELEQSHYHDILQWDFMDTFYNLTLKQVLFLEWMERNCPKVRFLFNGDDDVFAHTNNMVKYLQTLEDNDGSKHLYTGHLIQFVGPIRESWSKYFIPVQVYASDSYPPYCGGGGFLLSGYTASVIYNMSKSISLLPIDDVYMGMCLAKAGLSPSLHMGVKTAGLHVPSSIDYYDPCFYKEVLLVHSFNSAEMFFMWDRVNDPYLKCKGKFK